MGCVSSEAVFAQKRKNTSNQTSTIRQTSEKETFSDRFLALENKQRSYPDVFQDQRSRMAENNRQLSQEVLDLKQAVQDGKKQSQAQMLIRDKQFKQMQKHKERQIEMLQKKLQMQQKKSKSTNSAKTNQNSSSSPDSPRGVKSLEAYKGLCKVCFDDLLAPADGLSSGSDCFSCRGYGVVPNLFPTGSVPSCDNSDCLETGRDKIKLLKLCSICSGKGTLNKNNRVRR